MLGIGLVLLGIAVFCGIRYRQHQKHLAMGQEEQLVDPMLMGTSEDELREFGQTAPDITPNERPFNAGGRPMVTATGMLDGNVNKTS